MSRGFCFLLARSNDRALSILRKPTTDHETRDDLPPQEHRGAPAIRNLRVRVVREDDRCGLVLLTRGQKHLPQAPGPTTHEPAGIFDVPADHGACGDAAVETVEARGQLLVARGEQAGKGTPETTTGHVGLSETGGRSVEAAAGTEHAGTQHQAAIDQKADRAGFRRQVPVSSHGSAEPPAHSRRIGPEGPHVQPGLVAQRPVGRGVDPPLRRHPGFQYQAETRRHRLGGGIEPQAGAHQRHSVQEILGRRVKLTLHHGGGGADPG